MPLPESEELQKAVKNFIAETRLGEMKWRSVNPTTYVWEGTAASGSPAKLTLQRITQKTDTFMTGLSLTSTHFLLQVNEIDASGDSNVRLSLSGASDSGLNIHLEELYQMIASGFTEKGLEFLKSLTRKLD